MGGVQHDYFIAFSILIAYLFGHCSQRNYEDNYDIIDNNYHIYQMTLE